MKQSKAFHKGIRRVWSRLSAGSGTSRPEEKKWRNIVIPNPTHYPQLTNILWIYA